MDAVITVGQYNMVSMFLNSVGVQIDGFATDRFPAGVPLPAPPSRRGYTRPSKARIPLLHAGRWTPEQRSLIEEVNSSGTVGNLYLTVIHHPLLFAPRWKFGSYLLRDSRLPGRDREILIMRIAWLTRCEYEWAHHAPIARRNGMTGEEILRIAKGAGAPGWSGFDATLLRAVDELHFDAFLSDATWEAIATKYDDNQMMDLILTVGGYNMTAMLLNSFGVQLEDGYEGFPDLE